jgi:hypothetical protein
VVNHAFDSDDGYNNVAGVKAMNDTQVVVSLLNYGKSKYMIAVLEWHDMHVVQKWSTLGVGCSSKISRVFDTFLVVSTTAKVP